MRRIALILLLTLTAGAQTKPQACLDGEISGKTTDGHNFEIYECKAGNWALLAKPQPCNASAGPTMECITSDLPPKPDLQAQIDALSKRLDALEKPTLIFKGDGLKFSGDAQDFPASTGTIDACCAVPDGPTWEEFRKLQDRVDALESQQDELIGLRKRIHQLEGHNQ